MIYRAEFVIHSTASKLISPVIFGSLLDKIFELVDEKRAEEIIKRIVEEKVLISDAQPMVKQNGSWQRCFYKIHKPEFKNIPEDLPLKQKRDIARKLKKESGQINFLCVKDDGKFEEVSPNDIRLEKTVDFSRVGIQVNRINGMSEEGIFFYHQEFRFSPEQRYAIYINIDDSFIKNVFEQCFKIIELTGFGPDVSIGKGKIEFIEEDGHILHQDAQINRIFLDTKKGNECVNISSTVLDAEIEKNCEFKSFLTLRYDSKSPFGSKPPYFYALSGSIVVPKEQRIVSIKRYKELYLFSCVFPLRLN